MARWLYNFELKDLLSDGESPTEAVHVAKEIAKRLQQNTTIPGQKRGLINYFDRIKESDADPLAEVNEGLNRLYDWADMKRVWIK